MASPHLRLPLAVLLLVAGPAGAAQTRIPNVPYHRQLNGYGCGAASTEMMIHFHHGRDVDQRSVMDVVRTSPVDGTLSLDVVRAGHFSKLSQTAGNLFPDQELVGGWPGAADGLGMAAFGLRQQTCWVGELRTLLQQTGLPVVLLMFDNMVRRVGHFRVAVGADDDTIMLHDPWDRDGWPELAVFNDTYLCELWTHAERNLNTTYDPYFGAVFAPWEVSLAHFHYNGNVTQIVGQVKYPCPAPLCTASSPLVANNAFAELSSLPDNWSLHGPSRIELGSVKPGQQFTVTWNATIVDTEDKPATVRPLTMTAAGTITAQVPAVWRTVADQYPAYNYSDLIGATASINF